jgi:hypothetical protein
VHRDGAAEPAHPRPGSRDDVSTESVLVGDTGLEPLTSCMSSIFRLSAVLRAWQYRAKLRQLYGHAQTHLLHEIGRIQGRPE